MIKSIMDKIIEQVELTNTRVKYFTMSKEMHDWLENELAYIHKFEKGGIITQYKGTPIRLSHDPFATFGFRLCHMSELNEPPDFVIETTLTAP